IFARAAPAFAEATAGQPSRTSAGLPAEAPWARRLGHPAGFEPAASRPANRRSHPLGYGWKLPVFPPPASAFAQASAGKPTRPAEPTCPPKHERRRKRLGAKAGAAGGIRTRGCRFEGPESLAASVPIPTFASICRGL